MQTKTNQIGEKFQSVFLVLIMVLSTTAAFATNASASAARNYTTNRDPIDIGIADFNCDGHNDMAIATDGTHTISILLNDGNGDFTDRYDVWVSKNTSRNAEWDEFSNVQFLEVGEFNGDSAPDIAIFQRNNPFKTDDNGAPAGEPGNLTILENDGCSSNSFTIGQRFTHFWAWDLAVGDINQDGNDDIVILDLLADISNQRVVTYLGPVTSACTPNVNCYTTALGPASTASYRSLEVGDWGESDTTVTGQCFDEDIWLLRSEGVDYATGQTTTPGNDDNVTILEWICQSKSQNTGSFPNSYSHTTNQQNTHIVNMANTFGAFDIGDMDDDGTVDTIAMTQGNLENITFSTSSTVGTWSTPALAYFGPYISYDVTVADINGDGEPDFVNPTVAYQQNTSDSAGGSTSSFWLNFPTTVQVTLSDGSGGHVTPLSYEAGRRPNIAVVGQLAGVSTSAPDIVVGHASYNFGNWVDNLGWDGQYDYVTVVEMDSKDIAVTGIEINPVDRFFGIVGEGTRDINVTITNTGMDTLTQSATLDVELKVVDEVNSSNTTVFSHDFDTPEDATGCGGGCTWSFDEYIDQSSSWILETNHSVGATDGNNAPNVSANYQNPTDFMWAGEYKTNSSGDEWSGYGRHWDDALTLRDVDLTGSDRAFLSVELFRHLGYGALGSIDASNGQWLIGDLWDDVAMIEVGSEETGWSTIACPTSAQVAGECLSGASIWGGYDNDRAFKINGYGGVAEGRYYYGVFSSGTYYGWSNFTQEGVGEFDLSPWAGETVDVRFRLRSGFEGSIADDNESRWSGRDGYAIDNVTIYKQNTAYFPNPQTLQRQLNLQNLGPGETETANISANLLNDTIYRISATLSNHAWDEQSVNDDIIGYVQPFNLYDPAIEGIDYFNPGGLYAEGMFDIDVVTNNWGNTMVDFDVKATVFSATPSDILCGATAVICKESFEGGANGYVYSDDGNPQGAIYNEVSCNDVIFNNNAYWFGHPCDTATQGYGELWENETLTIPGVDLTSMSGDFVSLNFEYYADTFYGIDVDGTSIVDVNDYASINVDYTKGSDSYSAVLLGQWNDYDEDGTCQNDDNNDGFTNSSESINQAEISFIGDSASTDGSGGNYNVFFNSDDLVLSRSIDLTHLYVLNNTAADSLQWFRECISLAGSTADINFEFQSDDDGRNGLNDGFKGVAFNNITLQEFTFYEDASYTVSRTNVDAEDVATTTVANHEFFSGVYMIRAETIFDNTTAGVPWFGDDELSNSNNIEQVIFNVESVDITLGKPSTLTCLDDGVYECVLPIDGSLTHNWDLKATNGVLAGDYMFYMTVFDETDGVQVHQEPSAQTTTTLTSNERIDLTFPAYTGWMDGHTYNISFHAELANGNPSGNVRYFHATFADQIDVAILSDSTARTSIIKEDLQLLGMTYTQFAINDWTTYLDSGWMTHYDKILLPWQEDIAAKDVESGGRGYYQKLGSTANRQTLESFMSAGGTVQAHLGPQGSQIYGLDVGLNGRLPFGMDVQSRNTPETKIIYTDLDIADPFHPIMDDVSTTAFQGFEGDGTVATAVLNTNSVSTQNVPGVCNGYMEDGGYFQSLLRTSANSKDVIMGTCSYYQGGMIVSTIDVATYSSRADSTTFPILGNMLGYSVTPYPEGFGAMGQDLGLTIDGDEPGIDPSTGGYAKHYMKSDATVDFGYTSATSATLTADWILDGPTNWMGQTMASGTDHISEASPSATFCKTDLSSATGCLQGAQWAVTLLLHDDVGHARIISVLVETNDVLADAFAPEANMSIDMRDEYMDNIEFIGTKTVSNTEWDVNRVILTEAEELVLHFDASESFDADAIDREIDNGILTYEWKVFFDAPYGDTSFNLEGHTFEESAASNGLFSYKFQNVTVDDSGTAESQIRMELRVYDASGKFSDKFRMYFVVVPEGFGDEIPVVQYNDFENTSVGVSESTYTITGTILSGSETGEVYVEAAFSREDFSASAIEKYNLITDNKFDRSSALADSDTFELTLDIDEFYSNTSEVVEIWVRVYEGDDERWSDDLTKMVLINLKQCRGALINESALAAGGQFVWNATTSECDWVGGDDAWIYDAENNSWSEPTTDNQAGENEEDSNLWLIIGIVASILVLLLVSVFFLRGGSGDKVDNLSAAAAGYGQEMDMTEQYVQQLIAQGYPEETARAYAAQYVGQAAAAAPAAEPAASNDLYTQYYNQYYQQFVAQGYDEATAAQYAQQYAAQAQQQQQ